MKKLSIHTLMHVPFEGLGCIEQWISKNNHTVSYTRLYEDYQLPNPDEIDWLIVMGGPMGVYDEAVYPWLAEEKKFIKQVIEKGKTVIGICLGSQLIAEVLGAKVYPNKQKEIGWFNLQITEEGKNQKLLNGFEEKFTVFHWHGDTYDLPADSIRLFSSEACLNQAFLYNDNVVGLQFHFEATTETLKEMVAHGTSELIENETIQTGEQILAQTGFIDSNNKKMFDILDYFLELD
ncbi:MAG: type 1 glutamine amidotransferase [Paludibacter sp.]